MFPVIFTRVNCCNAINNNNNNNNNNNGLITLQKLLKRLIPSCYQIAKKAHTIYAFGTLEKDAKRVKGGTGWTVQLVLDQGKEVYLFDISSQTWYRSENYYYVSDDSACLVTGSTFLPWGLKPPPFIKAVLWLVPEILTRKPEMKSKPYSTAPSVYPRTLNN